MSMLFSFLAAPCSEFKRSLGSPPAQPQSAGHRSIWGLSALNECVLTSGMFCGGLHFSLSSSEQPNHAEEENCAVIRTESSGRWQNRDCSVALPYVCKKRPNATLDPFTTGQCVQVKQSRSESCQRATLQHAMGLISRPLQIRGQMMRSMSVMWAGRPSRPAATSSPRRR